MNGNIKLGGMVAATLLGCLGLAVSAQGASFDCGKAGSKVEHLICDNPEISKLDDELSVAYKSVLKEEKQTDSIKQAQKQWMKNRNSCAEVACVKSAYDSRMKALGLSIQSAESDKVSMITTASQTDNAKSAEQESHQMPPKLRYTFCDRNKPELYCEGQTGKGYAVCEVYLKNLQALTTPPTCEAPIPPGYKQPVWEEMDIMQHLELAYQAEEFFLKRYGGYKHPDFETWRLTFLKEIHEGKISPRMRKTRVAPNDKGDATILAYTRDRDACHKSYEWEKRRKVQIDQLPANTPAWSIEKQIPGYPYPHWSDQGDVHFVLTDDKPTKLQVIVGDASKAQMDVLLYGDRAYLVQVLEPIAPIYNGLGSNVRGANTSSITIFAFDPRFPDRIRLQLDLNHYLVEARCQFTPY